MVENSFEVKGMYCVTATMTNLFSLIEYPTQLHYRDAGPEPAKPCSHAEH